jgi:RNA-directed DNA polymerase
MDFMSAIGLTWAQEHPLPEQTIMRRIVSPENMRTAYRQVIRNKGSCGVDGMKVTELKPYLRQHWPKIKTSLLTGTYKPQPVKQVEIPKPNGGVRILGIPTVLDRLLQQAIYQVLSPIFDPHFSEYSYGFRTGKRAHQAIEQARRYQAEGKRHVVDMDLEKFFDRVNHDVLITLVRRRMNESLLLKLMRVYLASGIMIGGTYKERKEGTPQGSPLSPLLSNIILDELDKELEKRGHSFVRYADDCNIYVRSQKAGERILGSISEWLKRKLKLPMNWEKSTVDVSYRRKFLGYSFTWHKQPLIRVPLESVQRIKEKLKRLFREGRGRNIGRFITETLNPALRGWINYFRISQTKGFAEELDQWVRRRLRNMLWRQWKRPWTRFKRLREAGFPEEQSAASAFNGRGAWWNSGASHMNLGFPKKYFDQHGLVCMQEILLRSQKNMKP